MTKRLYLVSAALVAAAAVFSGAGLGWAQDADEALCRPYEESWAKASNEADLTAMNTLLASIPDSCAVKAKARAEIDQLEAAQADRQSSSESPNPDSPAPAPPALYPDAAADTAMAPAADAATSEAPQGGRPAAPPFDDPMSSIPPSGVR
jgi:hypothetical protein